MRTWPVPLIPIACSTTAEINRVALQEVAAIIDPNYQAIRRWRDKTIPQRWIRVRPACIALSSAYLSAVISAEAEMDMRTRGAVPSFEEQERDVRRDFWTTLKRLAGQVPFVEDLVAAYYCALDPATPMRVRGILLAALAYFIVRWRYRPLTWLWRFPGLGFTDDAAVLSALFGLSSHITPVHQAAAARALGKKIRRT
jgi:uncharacterized membrane protein YkvA (DUF1232 family)